MDTYPVFIDETGILIGPAKEQPVYGIGLLVVKNPSIITDSLYRLHFNFKSTRANERGRLIRAIRAEERSPSLPELDLLLRDTWHHEYKFTEVTRGNLQQYIDLLNVYFSVADFEFHALLVNRLDERFRLDRWGGDQWRAYVAIARELLQRRLKVPAFVIADLQGEPLNPYEHLEDSICMIPHVRGCLRASSETFVYLQITDLLLGCLQFDWRDTHGHFQLDSGRAGVKRRLVAFVKAQLGLPPGAPILTEAQPYRRKTRPPPFSAWLWRPA